MPNLAGLHLGAGGGRPAQPGASTSELPAGTARPWQQKGTGTFGRLPGRRQTPRATTRRPTRTCRTPRGAARASRSHRSSSRTPAGTSQPGGDLTTETVQVLSGQQRVNRFILQLKPALTGKPDANRFFLPRVLFFACQETRTFSAHPETTIDRAGSDWSPRLTPAQKAPRGTPNPDRWSEPNSPLAGTFVHRPGPRGQHSEARGA